MVPFEQRSSDGGQADHPPFIGVDIPIVTDMCDPIVPSTRVRLGLGFPTGIRTCSGWNSMSRFVASHRSPGLVQTLKIDSTLPRRI